MSSSGNVVDRGQKRIKELRDILQKEIHPRDRIDALVELSWELRMIHPEQSYSLSQQSRQLATSGDFSPENPYLPGLAGSLANMAFVETYNGQLDDAVSKCLDVISRLALEPPCCAILDAWTTLGWISFFLGDYPSALENGYKALNLSREQGLHLYEAWAMDVIASISGATQEYEMAIQYHTGALAIFKSLDDLNGELRTLNNLAFTLYLMGNYEEALHAGLESLSIARRPEFDAQAFSVHCTVAQILIDMQVWDQAEAHLREAVTSSSEYGPANVAQVSIYIEWGRLSLMRGDLESAETHLLTALQLSDEYDRLAEKADCHLRLSEVYEKQGRFSQALTHYKQYHALKELVLGDQNAKRLAILNITHQVEDAKRDKEIYRLQAVQLQREVEEHRRLQEMLERLSRQDGLTGLFNRRYFDEKLADEYARHSRSGKELSLLLLDVDHFKAFNDTYGHVQGDECLRKVARVISESIRRPSDFAARYGGEEFVCLLPETDAQGGRFIAEKISKAILDLSIPHASSSTAGIVTSSIGVITARCTPRWSAQDLVARADQQLYQAKTDGRNLIRSAQKLDTNPLITQ